MTPTVFKIREQEVVASWPGSAKTCLGCKTTGHSTSLCPRRNPKMKKVGESVNPLQKIGKGGQSRKGKEKESEVSTGSSEKMKAPAPATRTTPATIASGSASGKAIQPPKPPGSGAPKKAAATTSAMEEDNPFGPGLLSGTSTDTAIPVERFTTPPPRDLPDPVTPRSEAGKRMALDEDIWVPTNITGR